MTTKIMKYILGPKTNFVINSAYLRFYKMLNYLFLYIIIHKSVFTDYFNQFIINCLIILMNYKCTPIS